MIESRWGGQSGDLHPTGEISTRSQDQGSSGHTTSGQQVYTDIDVEGASLYARENTGGVEISTLSTPSEESWAARLRRQLAERQARRDRMDAFRADHAHRRRHGLRARHRQKLDHVRAAGVVNHNTEETPMNAIYTTETGGEDPDAGPPHQWAITINGKYVSGDRGNELNPVLTELRGNSKRWRTYPDAAAAASQYRTHQHPRADRPQWADADIQIIRIDRPRRFR